MCHLQILQLVKSDDWTPSHCLTRSPVRLYIDPPPLHFESQVRVLHLLRLTQPHYQTLSNKEVHVGYLQIIPVGKGEDSKVIHEVIHLSPVLYFRVVVLP